MNTCLNVSQYVPKTHVRIELRGRLDSLGAQIILFQVNSGKEIYINDLEEVRKIIMRLQNCEAGEKIFEGVLILWNIDENELHERSHDTKKFYGKGHLLPTCSMGREAAEINFLRTLVRETELCACRAFNNDDTLRIIHALNRLSSALYILEYKYIPEDYKYIWK